MNLCLMSTAMGLVSRYLLFILLKHKQILESLSGFLSGKISSCLVDILDLIKTKCLKNIDHVLCVSFQPHLLFSLKISDTLFTCGIYSTKFSLITVFHAIFLYNNHILVLKNVRFWVQSLVNKEMLRGLLQ